MKRFDFASSLIASLLITVWLSACSTTSPVPTATFAPAPTLSAPTATSAPEPTPVQTPTLPPTSTPASTATPDLPLALTSTAFAEGDAIPDQYTYTLPGQCAGQNISPPLSWVGAPANTQSFAILVVDPDGGDWVHWMQFNIPADTSELSEAVGGPDVGVKGQNDFGELGYGGPCPPSGTHRYVFTLYALDTLLSVSEGAAQVEVETAMEGHVLEEAQLTGLRSKE